MVDESSDNKRDSLSRFNFDENPKEAQDAFMKTVLNPEKNDNIKKTKWVADGFTTLAKENLPIPSKTKNRKKLNTVSSITAIINKPV